jgi:rhomboid family GlyGly-CTERM serine protease
VRTERSLLVATTAGLILVSNLLPGDSVAYDRAALAHGELWRLWTGQFCHWSALHLAGNLAALAGVAIVAGRTIRRWLALLPIAAPLLSAFLFVAAPALERYRGLSGLVALLVVGAAVEGGAVGRLLALAYLGKLAFDAATGSHSVLLPEGIVTAWPAHLGGILLGLLAALGFRLHAVFFADKPR